MENSDNRPKILKAVNSFCISVCMVLYRLFHGTGIGRWPLVKRSFSFISGALLSSKDIVEVEGSKMFVNPINLPAAFRNTFGSYAFSTSWEELTTKLFKETVKEGDVVVDLGANVGYFTLLAARLAGPKGRVYSFEPEPNNFSVLLRNIEINGYSNVVPNQKAVSDSIGKMQLFIDNDDTGGHSIYPGGSGGRHIDIDVVSLDDFFKDKEKRINVIKMDIEGAEMSALSGMKGTLKANPNLKIFIEFYFPAIKRSGEKPEEVARKLLEEYNFSIVALGEYTQEKKSIPINTVADLMELCKGERTANLFLQRKVTSNA